MNLDIRQQIKNQAILVEDNRQLTVPAWDFGMNEAARQDTGERNEQSVEGDIGKAKEEIQQNEAFISDVPRFCDGLPNKKQTVEDKRDGFHDDDDDFRKQANKSDSIGSRDAGKTLSPFLEITEEKE